MKKSNPNSVYWKYDSCRSELAKKRNKEWMQRMRTVRRMYYMAYYYDRCIPDVIDVEERMYDYLISEYEIKERIERNESIKIL